MKFKCVICGQKIKAIANVYTCGRPLCEKEYRRYSNYINRNNYKANRAKKIEEIK
jgi:hypothetical protein